jgi:predicted  nucleic acid-binding Zn-ribbon protein
MQRKCATRRIFYLERAMEEQLNLLIQLQDVDGVIRARKEEKKKLPVLLAELERKNEENRAGLDRVREALETAQKNKRERDRDLEEGGQKVEKLKARTPDIKTNKEYTALLKEIETAEQENKVIEEDILKLMERIDAAASEIKAAESRSTEEAAAIETERKQLEENMAKLEAELAGVERERNELAARIDAALLAQYEKRSRSLSGKVVVEARGESCAGCFMSIPPQIFVNVKKNQSIISCPHCHRILYYKEAIAPK